MPEVGVFYVIKVPTSMKGKTRERWVELCEQAATEQDPIRLMQLVQEINKLLIEKEERLDSMRAGKLTRTRIES